MSELERDGWNIYAAYQQVKSKLRNLVGEVALLWTTAKYSAGTGIINGKFSVNQKAAITSGTDAAVNVTYQIDQWRTVLSGITAYILHSSGKLKYTATSTATGQVGGDQALENYADYEDETITVSALTTSNSSDARLIVYNGSSVIGYSEHTGSGEEELLSVTVKVPSGGSELRIINRITSSTSGTVSVASSDYIEFTDVRLDLGEHRLSGDRTYQQEFAECKRFYRDQDFYVPATTAQSLGIIDMRATPTITGGGAGFASTGTTKDTLIAYQTSGGIQTLALSAEL